MTLDDLWGADGLEKDGGWERIEGNGKDGTCSKSCMGMGSITVDASGDVLKGKICS